MATTWFVLPLCLFLCCSYIKGRVYLGDLAMQNPDLFGGDMLGVEVDDRNAIVDKRKLWPGGVVYYVEDPSLRSEVFPLTLKGAFDQFKRNTCIRFVKRTNEVDYVKIFKGDGCYSHVGRTGGEQPLSLGEECDRIGVIMHELCHAIGFYHEQNRSDRDDYLTIFWDNILEVNQGDINMQNPDLVGGDMLGVEANDRNAVVDKRKLWPGGVVYYVVDPSLRSQAFQQILNSAFDQFKRNTCIRFVKRTNEVNYVKIFKGKGCYSKVGRTGGEQPLSLGEECDRIGVIMHELCHVIGFEHEQNRSDRDNYLTIFFNNILKGSRNQFNKLWPTQNQLLTPFDYDSLMLYGSYSFSKDYGMLMTMVGKGNRFLPEVAFKYRLSKGDIQMINMLYRC